MKILHVDTDDIENPLRGGQPVRTFEINSRLTKSHQIKVLTSTYRGCHKKVTRGLLEYERLGMTLPGWGLSSHLSFLFKLRSAVAQTPHDLLVEEFTPPFGFCNLQRYTHKPVVSIVQWHFFKDWEKRYKLPFSTMMQKRAPMFAPRHIIVQTHKMGAQFRALLPDANIVKIPCGINSEAFHQSNVRGNYVLFLGRLDILHKGIDDLLMAWKMLGELGEQIPLWIAGAGPDEALLRQKVYDLGLSERVSFTGRLEGDQKRTALKNCRFMVMPSRQETFGITALEAMACSKLVVAYDIDHLNELLQPNWSSLVPLGNVRQFANKVLSLWRSEYTCIEMGQYAYKEARKYLWDELAKQQEAFYLSVSEN